MNEHDQGIENCDEFKFCFHGITNILIELKHKEKKQQLIISKN